MESKSHTKIVSYLGIILAAYFIFLCSVHLATRRPLWLDEASLMNSFKELSPAQLFGPLRVSQAFPRLYLYLIHSLSSQFNFNVVSLRILPFFFMLSAFGIWLKIYRKEEKIGTGYLLFILCWCGSVFMSYYAAEFKQYSAELFVASLFTIFLLRQKGSLDNDSFNYLLALQYLFLPFSLLFSYSGYFFVLIPAYNLLVSLRKSRKNIRYLIIYAASIALVVYFSFNFDIKYNDLKGNNYNWSSYFISTSSFGDFISTFWEGFRRIFVRWFWKGKPMTYIMTFFLPFTAFFLFKSGIEKFREDKGRLVSLSSITLALLTGMFVAGILKIWPFTADRITLFMAPFIFYAIVKGIEMFRGKVFPLYMIMFAVFSVSVFANSVRIFIDYLHRFS